MALIEKDGIVKLDKDRNSIHKPAKATYTTFEKNGQKFFQIDTYGSSERIIKEKMSQSIQIDREVGKYLADLLKQEFNL